MRTLSQYISEKLIINKNFKNGMICPTSYRELKNIIGDRCKQDSEYIDLTDIDVSKVPYFVDLSGYSIFGKLGQQTKVIDVTGWDVSHIKNMFELFAYFVNLKEIKGIENWDISNVTNMKGMFQGTPKSAIPSWYK